MKYMGLVTKEVEGAVARTLPEFFCILFDGWTCEESSTHYVAISASYEDRNGDVKVALLAFTPFEDESSFTALDHKDMLVKVLGIFKKSLKNVVCLVGDNCPVNKKLANDCEKPLVGCAAHRFNLEVQMFLQPYKQVLDKVNLIDDDNDLWFSTSMW